MTHRKFASSPWARYSKKLISAIENPRHAGIFTEEQATTKGMRLATISSGSMQEGAAFTLYLLIDKSDGVIADAKFQLFGPAILIGALEITCQILIRKPASFLKKITTHKIDGDHAFPEESFPYLNAIIEALDELSLQCSDLMYAPPTPIQENQEEACIYPDWEYLSKEEQMKIIQEVIDADIRPYIELDAGGIEILDLVGGTQLHIAYQGACTTCYSSTGATLNAIQGILQKKIHPLLTVIPKL